MTSPQDFNVYPSLREMRRDVQGDGRLVTLNERYQGIPGVLPSTDECQMELVNRCVDAALRVSVHHIVNDILGALTPAEIVSDNKNAQLAQLAGKLSEHCLLRRFTRQNHDASSQNTGDLEDSSETMKQRVADILKEYYEQQVAKPAEKTQTTNVREIVRLLYERGLLQNSEDLTTFNELKEYRERIVEFKEKMSALDQRIDTYIATLKIHQDAHKAPLLPYIENLEQYREDVLQWRDDLIAQKPLPPKPPENPTDLAPCDLAIPYTLVPRDPRVRHLTDHTMGEIIIHETGSKAMPSAEKKLRRSKNIHTGSIDGVDARTLHDVNRITISPLSPQDGELFKYYLCHKTDSRNGKEKGLGAQRLSYHETGITIKISGQIDEMLYILLKKNFAPGSKGVIAEVKIQEDHQVMADMEEHEIYEVTRLMAKREVEYDPDKISGADLVRFQERYCDIMERYYKKNQHNGVAYTIPKNIVEAGGVCDSINFGTEEFAEYHIQKSMPDDEENTAVLMKHDELKDEFKKILSARCRELFALSQSIFINAAAHSSPEWQEIYLKHAYKLDLRRDNSLEHPIHHSVLEKIGSAEMRAQCLEAARKEIREEKQRESQINYGA